MIEAKAFRISARVYRQFRSEHLRAKSLINTHHIETTYNDLTPDTIGNFAADSHLLKLQRLQNKFLHTFVNFSKSHTNPRWCFQNSVRV